MVRPLSSEHAPSLAKTREARVGAWRVVTWPLACKVVLPVCFAKMVRPKRAFLAA